MSDKQPIRPDARVLLRAFGAEVKRRRIEHELPLEQLAARSGLQPAFISHVEKSGDVSLSTMMQIADGLGSHRGELLPGRGGLSAAALAAGRSFDAIESPDRRAGVMRLLRGLEHVQKSTSRSRRARRAPSEGVGACEAAWSAVQRRARGRIAREPRYPARIV